MTDTDAEQITQLQEQLENAKMEIARIGGKFRRFAEALAGALAEIDSFKTAITDVERQRDEQDKQAETLRYDRDQFEEKCERLERERDYWKDVARMKDLSYKMVADAADQALAKYNALIAQTIAIEGLIHSVAVLITTIDKVSYFAPNTPVGAALEPVRQWLTEINIEQIQDKSETQDKCTS